MDWNVFNTLICSVQSTPIVIGSFSLSFISWIVRPNIGLCQSLFGPKVQLFELLWMLWSRARHWLVPVLLRCAMEPALGRKNGIVVLWAQVIVDFTANRRTKHCSLTVKRIYQWLTLCGAVGSVQLVYKEKAPNQHFIVQFYLLPLQALMDKLPMSGVVDPLVFGRVTRV